MYFFHFHHSWTSKSHFCSPLSFFCSNNMFTWKTIVGWGIRCSEEKLLSTTMCTLHTAMPECKAVDQLFGDFLCSIFLLKLFFYKSLQEIHLKPFTDTSINYNKYIRHLWNKQQQQNWHVQATTLTNTTNQSGRKCGVGSHCTCSHFFWLIAHILTILDKKYRILTRRDKRESYLIVLQQNNV